MKELYLGKIVNTHGIKGEIRILSDFEKKDRIFQPGKRLYIGPSRQEVIITSYRHHKMYDMVTLEGYTDINQVLPWKGQAVYCKREELGLNQDEFLMSDLIGMRIQDQLGKCGKVVGVRVIHENNRLLEVLVDQKKEYIPLQKEFIRNIDFEHQKIEIESQKGLW